MILFQIRVEAFDHGTPTPLSSDLDLTIYVKNVNDYQPQFLVEDFPVNFTGKLIVIPLTLITCWANRCGQHKCFCLLVIYLA